MVTRTNRGFQRRIAIALLSACALGGAVAADAPASSIHYRCGANLCRIDPATKKVKRLTRNGSNARGRSTYSDVSVSRNGRVLAFNFGDELFVARGDASHRRRLEKRAGIVEIDPAGRFVASIYSTYLPNFGCFPSYTCPLVLTPYLHLRPIAGKEKGVASRVVSTGWLGERLLRDDEPSNQLQQICVLRRNTDSECDRTVARDSARDLFSPAGSPDSRYVAVAAVPHRENAIRVTGRIALFSAATGRLVRDLTRGTDDGSPSFSPDGRSIVFDRGRDLYVVPTAGGTARRLVRGGVEPSWGR